jgi:hypothetical protein
MNIKEILQMVDHWVFAETDQHLDDLQKTIIEEISQGKTYKQIADLSGYHENYVGDESRKLFKILSEKLGEEINKHNFFWTFERVTDHSQGFNVINANLNLCPNHQTSNNNNNPDNNQQKSNFYDLTFAPQILKFYNRETELKKLNKYIFKQNIKLISVLGLSGIGKTYLVKRFVDLNLDQFEVIIWKNLKYPESLDLVIDDILNLCQIKIKPNKNNKLKQLFDIFTQKKCLIIFDNIENIFIKEQFAGQYQTKFKDYQDLFTMITENDHQSNVILISQESCAEMQNSDQDLTLVKCLELSGLNEIDILTNLGLKDEDSWLNLVKLYEGNYLYLKKYISPLIKNIFAGKVTDFLEENTLFLTEDMKSHLREIFDRLSLIEKQIVQELSKFDQPISREDLRQNLDLPFMDLVMGLQSLKQRYLLTKIEEETILFSLSPILREYVKKS